MKKNILVLGAGGNASRNYVKSLKLDEKYIGNIIGVDINESAEYFSNTDKFYLLNQNDKLSNIQKIIDIENIDFVHAQPDKEVYFISENKNYLNAKTIDVDKKLFQKYSNKEFTNRIWSKSFKSFTSYPYVEVENNKDLFFDCLQKSGKAWVRLKSGAGSSGALPVNTIKQLKNWVDYWVEFRNAVKTDFIVSEYLPGKEYAVQIFYWKGEIYHFQARERIEYFFANQMISGQSSTPSIAKTVVNEDLQKTALKAICDIEPEPHGIYCVDLKENNEQEIIPMEVNYGRFFTTSYFFSALNVNTPLDVIKKSFGFEISKKINFLTDDYYCFRGLDMDMKILNK